jgi:hypothetical protein
MVGRGGRQRTIYSDQDEQDMNRLIDDEPKILALVAPRPGGYQTRACAGSRNN